ncbi:MAG: dipeptidase PepV [Clostridia bacterium]|nr:dipeptidase PepV [Clostridia bacterium]
MKQRVYELIDSYREQYVETLQRWIRIPSVKGEAEDGAPFGREVRRMLDTASADAKALGFDVREFDGYACDVTLGGAEEKIAVLGHLDVVPVGDGWTKPPFDALIENGRIYGRGTNDDKGPALAALFAMKAIRDAGIPLKKGIRLILGCDEESGWEDMAYYGAHEQIPDVGFSPDASFPLINTEKGMLGLELRAPAAEGGLKILEFATGDRVNVIPGECRALVEGNADTAARVKAYAERTGLPYTAETTDRGVLITATGIPGHSAYPEGKRNAIGMMLLLLKELGAEGPVATLAEAVGLESDGKSLGCACRDEVSEGLTCNMGILRLENGAWYGTLDMRCPVTADQEKLRDSAIARLPGFSVETATMKPPHHVPAESELVTNLLAAYEEETGLEGKPMSTGGGTYAKVLKQGVAFGALFPDEEDLAHQADEYEEIDRLMLAMKIYANALIRLASESMNNEQ